MMETFQEINVDPQMAATEKITNMHVIRGIHYIRQHLYSEINASDVAEGIRMDPSYLSSLFKKETGISLQKYILQEKIEEAEKMLANTDYPIREIGEALGFCSAPHFTKVFRQLTGKNPSEYRRSC